MGNLIKIKNLRLKNYRNHIDIKIEPKKNIIIIYGKNGSGKTNILESISLIGKGRGFRNANIKNLIHKSEFSFDINAEYEFNNNLYKVNINCLNPKKKL